MITDAWWVVDPIGHRAESNRQAEEWLKVEEPGITKVHSGSDVPLDMWVCDWCNSDIDVVIDGKKQFVPMFLSNALCVDCYRKEVRKHPDALALAEDGAHPWEVWSSKACSCPACAAEFDAIVKEGRRGNSGDTDTAR